MRIKTARWHLLRRAKELKIYGIAKMHRRMETALAGVLDVEGHSGAMDSPPACFGKACAVHHNKVCQACPVQIMCLHRMAHVALPAAAKEAGTFTCEGLAAHMGLQPEDIRIAQSLALHTGLLLRRHVNAAPMVAQDLGEGAENWPQRYLAERKRYPQLDLLPVGTKIYREFDGIRHCVTFEDGHYTVGRRRFATLFSAGEAITGKHKAPGSSARPTGNYSVRKLFGEALGRALQSLSTSPKARRAAAPFLRQAPSRPGPKPKRSGGRAPAQAPPSTG